MSAFEWGLPWPGTDVAAEAEAAGAAAFCAGEFADTNAYLTAQEMALGTSRALVGTGIAYAFARSPFVHASAARQLDRSASGRVFLGFGSGSRTMNRDWFASPFDPPVARMAELVRAVRALLEAENGDVVTLDGRFYALRAAIRAPVLGRLDIPILVGAFNAQMLGVAGGVADGVMSHGLFTDRWWGEVADPALAKAAASSGRLAEPRRWGWVITAVDDEDPSRAERDARSMIAFYLTVKTYNPLVALHGWGDAVADIRTAFGRGDTAAMAAAVTPDMLDAIAVFGTTSEGRERLAARRALPDLAFLAPPSFLVSERRRARYGQAIVAMMRR